MYTFNTLDKKIAIEIKNEVITLSASSIIMIEASMRKVTVYTKSGNFITNKSIKQWLNELKSLPFYQTHKSYIVNFAHVERFDNNLVYLTDNLKAYLTQRKFTAFKNNYMVYIDTTI